MTGPFSAPNNATLLSLTESVTSTNGDTNLQGIDRASVQINYTDATPGAKSFVAANVSVADDTITITAHGFVTGLKMALSGTNLPTGLSATNYWCVVVDANTIKLADSYAHAIAGTVVDITGQGTTADAALTPASFGSATVELKASLDNVTYFSFATPKSVTITGTGASWFDLGSINYPYLRAAYTAQVAGALTLTVLLHVRNTLSTIRN